ncbi:MAG: stress responsive protein [Zetaproteobacteria bacterium CG2_30_46_52]|nr:MAG: stress responsive protein [Zetaproteobacteria bacterium CG2_30_46_52]
MVKHIVMWKLHNKSDAREIKTTLEALKDKVPSIIDIEVGIDFSDSDASADVVLYSTFADAQGLADYQAHPDHQNVLPMMRRLTSSRMVTDYVY